MRKNDEKKCPACAEAIKAEATVCKNCGHAFSEEEVAAAVAKSKADKRYSVGGCLILIVLVIVGLVWLGSSNDEPPPPASSPSAISAPASPQGRTAFLATYRQLLAIAAPCDEANTQAADAVATLAKGNGDFYAAYEVAHRADQSCNVAHRKLVALDVPAAIGGANRTSVGAALDRCSTAYQERIDALDTLMKTLDGDLRPSTVSTYKDQAQQQAIDVMMCVGLMIDAGNRLGVTAKDLNGPAD